MKAQRYSLLPQTRQKMANMANLADMYCFFFLKAVISHVQMAHVRVASETRVRYSKEPAPTLETPMPISSLKVLCKCTGTKDECQEKVLMCLLTLSSLPLCVRDLGSDACLSSLKAVLRRPIQWGLAILFESFLSKISSQFLSSSPKMWSHPRLRMTILLHMLARA